MRTKRNLIIAALLCLLPFPSLFAQEVTRVFYSSPVGLTETDGLQVTISPLPQRAQGPASLCLAQVSLEILDAGDLTVLFQSGPVPLAIGSSFQADFTAIVGAAPARQEVIVKAKLDRTPGRSAERDTLAEICPIRGSAELYDLSTGAGLVKLIESTLDWQATKWSGFDEVTLR